MYSKVKLNLELKDEYTIDTLGVVFNVTKGYALKGTTVTKNNRYVKIHVDKFRPLHRLVAEHFIPNPDNLPQVNHKDGNRLNNAASNLEWCSARQNVKHAYASGLKSNHGELNPFRILSEQDVHKVWALRHTSLTARQIRDKLQLPVGEAVVKGIRGGRSWTSVTSKLN